MGSSTETLEGGMRFWQRLEAARKIDLSHPTLMGMPGSPNQPAYRMSIERQHGDRIRPDGSSSANELISMGGHTGTHIDALCHVSHRGRLHGGISAAAAQRSGGFSSLGVETLAPFFGRGVMLDIPRLFDLPCLPPTMAVTAELLERACELQQVDVRAGDAVFIRTGWARHWPLPARFVGAETGVPGPDESAAEWLAARHVALTGAETVAYERIAPGQGHRELPVHRILLVEAGIPILEMCELSQLAELAAFEFAIVIVPLKLVGATGCPVRPIALLETAAR